jgi:hypothetical protein
MRPPVTPQKQDKETTSTMMTMKSFRLELLAGGCGALAGGAGAAPGCVGAEAGWTGCEPFSVLSDIPSSWMRAGRFWQKPSRCAGKTGL